MFRSSTFFAGDWEGAASQSQLAGVLAALRGPAFPAGAGSVSQPI